MTRIRLVHPNSSLARACQWLVLTFSLISAVGCVSDPASDIPEESGVVGTGVILRGTVSEQKQLASIDLELRPQLGERFTVGIARDGQYIAPGLDGQGPWLMRSDLGNDNYQYGIGYASGLSHVHAYIDVIIRAWFLEEYAITDLNSTFVSDEDLPLLPTEQQFQAFAQPYLDVIDLVLEDYSLTPIDLFEEDFRNDDTRVDRFLKANPIVVDTRAFSIIKTDPRTNTQAFYSGDILLGGVGEQLPDTTPPDMPVSLRAFTTASGIVELIWEASADNSAVAGYNIQRDGEDLATTPYVTFTDDTVQPDTSYTYSVEAIDIADNVSALAAVTINSTSTVIDNQPPPAPRALTASSATTRQVQLSWIQDSVAEVAYFNVYRGFEANDLSMLARVTSTELVDATVSSSLDYWYAVSAVDASGNASQPSEPLMVRTTGIVIEPPLRPLNLVPPLAGLTIPDIAALNCNTTFPDYSISDETITVSSGCYTVEQDITVATFGILRLQPGVVLKFDAETGILIEPSGSLQSIGTAESPVVMTADRPSRGWWDGVEFNRTDSQLNQISHTVIEYGGSGSTGANIVLRSSTNATSVLRVDNSLIRFGGNYGISIPGLDGGLQSFSANLVTQNNRAAAVHYDSLPDINDGSDFSDNDLNFLFASFGNYDRDITINDAGLPLEISGINQLSQSPSRTIIINEGVEMYFGNDTVFNVRGNLAIRGTSANPVRLTSKNPNPGSWQGIQLIEGANAQLSNVIVENAGLPSEQNPEGASVFANNARISLENVTLRASASYGFHATGDEVVVDKFEQVNNVNNARQDVVVPVGQ